MKLLQLSGQEKTIEWIWEWYEYHLMLSVLSKIGIRTALIHGNNNVDSRFFGMTEDELDEFFDELNKLAMFDLLAATEAVVRLDYWTRVDGRKKDPVSLKFRDIYKVKQLEVRLVDDLLDTWKELHPQTKDAVGDFKGALLLRHWLAHGRYWEESFGQDYSPGDVFDICRILIDALTT